MIREESICLRAVEPGDADFMYEVENDSTAWGYGDTIAPISRNILREYALNYDANPLACGQLRMIVTESATGKPIGIADLYEISAIHRRAFAGIYILPEFRGRGYARQSIKALCRYCRGVLRLNKIAAKIEESNVGSIRLFTTSGFIHEASLRNWICNADGTFSDLRILTKDLQCI